MRDTPRLANSHATGADYRRRDTRGHDDKSHLLGQTRHVCAREWPSAMLEGILASEMVWSRLVKSASFYA